MKKTLFILLFSSTLIWSCSKPTEKVIAEEKITDTISESMPKSISQPPAPTGDNSMTSLDWAGTYFATLPCGRCEGIEMWVTLHPDGTYALNTNYLGLNDALEEEFTGKFSWDQSGSVVTLEGINGTYPGKFKVGENRIWYLDAEGNKMTGEPADQYILIKK